MISLQFLRAIVVASEEVFHADAEHIVDGPLSRTFCLSQTETAYPDTDEADIFAEFPFEPFVGVASASVGGVFPAGLDQEDISAAVAVGGVASNSKTTNQRLPANTNENTPLIGKPDGHDEWMYPAQTYPDDTEIYRVLEMDEWLFSEDVQAENLVDYQHANGQSNAYKSSEESERDQSEDFPDVIGEADAFLMFPYDPRVGVFDYLGPLNDAVTSSEEDPNSEESLQKDGDETNSSEESQASEGDPASDEDDDPLFDEDLVTDEDPLFDEDLATDKDPLFDDDLATDDDPLFDDDLATDVDVPPDSQEDDDGETDMSTLLADLMLGDSPQGGHHRGGSSMDHPARRGGHQGRRHRRPHGHHGHVSMTAYTS